MRNFVLKYRVLLVGGVGGHGEQITRVRRLLGNNFIYYLITEFGLKWEFPDQFTETYRVVDYHAPSRSKSICFFILAFFKAIKIITGFRPNACISTGPALALPVALACKLFGVKVLHIESWSRINSLSNTTRLLLKYSLVSRLYYQYEGSVLKDNRLASYCGHL